MTPAPASQEGAIYPAIGDTFPVLTFGPIDASRVTAYAAASGDTNPLHLDPAVAQSAGLPAPPIHGMLMMGCFEPALREWRADLCVIRLSTKFLRPVFSGTAIEISGRVVQLRDGQPKKIVVRLMAHGAGGDLAAVGEALLVPANTEL